MPFHIEPPCTAPHRSGSEIPTASRLFGRSSRILSRYPAIPVIACFSLRVPRRWPWERQTSPRRRYAAIAIPFSHWLDFGEFISPNMDESWIAIGPWRHSVDNDINTGGSFFAYSRFQTGYVPGSFGQILHAATSESWIHGFEMRFCQRRVLCI